MEYALNEEGRERTKKRREKLMLLFSKLRETLKKQICIFNIVNE